MTKITVKTLPDSEVELEGEIAAEQFNHYRPAALANLNTALTIDGFRQGHATEAAILAKVGEEKVLIEMAELALQAAYPAMIEEQKLDAIGRPNITITKLAKNNPLGFKIKTAVSPKISLKDYAAAAKKITAVPAEKIEVSAKEVDELLEDIRKSRAPRDEKTGALGQLPELTDEFAKTLGKFTDLADLKNKLQQNLQLEKEAKAKDKCRVQIIDAIIAASDIPLPPILVNSELDKMTAEMKYEIEKMHLKFEDYLSHLKKTETELRQNWQADAVKRVKTGLVLNEIAAKEKITPAEEEIKKELDHLKQHYPNTPEDRLRPYVTNLLTNEQVFVWLENQK